jgi:bacteriocin-like protein
MNSEIRDLTANELAQVSGGLLEEVADIVVATAVVGTAIVAGAIAAAADSGGFWNQMLIEKGIK